MWFFFFCAYSVGMKALYFFLIDFKSKVGTEPATGATGAGAFTGLLLI